MLPKRLLILPRRKDSKLRKQANKLSLLFRMLLLSRQLTRKRMIRLLLLRNQGNSRSSKGITS